MTTEDFNIMVRKAAHEVLSGVGKKCNRQMYSTTDTSSATLNVRSFSRLQDAMMPTYTLLLTTAQVVAAGGEDGMRGFTGGVSPEPPIRRPL